MAQALYREWRPTTFDEVVEQEHVVFALKQAIISGELAHAYLFTGTRGTGKTTMAKILARAVNCLHPHDGNPDNTCELCQSILNNTLTDVAEIDAASHNSVDNIRQITEEIIFLPARAKFKVYIIDEVHMLSTGAFNALLKTLEEPPSHAMFILATTEPHRLPATILSRCQRFDFKRISETSIAKRLEQIANDEGITIDTQAINAISLLADGALRDAISLLDQAKVSFPNGATSDDIRDMTGQVDRRFLAELVKALIGSDATSMLVMLDQMIRSGQDIVRFAHELASFYRDLLIIHATGDTTSLQSGALAGLVHATDSEIHLMKELAGAYQQPEVVERIKMISTLISDLRWSPNPRILLEVGLMRLSGTRAQDLKQQQSAAQQTASTNTMPTTAPLKRDEQANKAKPIVAASTTGAVEVKNTVQEMATPDTTANKIHDRQDNTASPVSERKAQDDVKIEQASKPKEVLPEIMDEPHQDFPEDYYPPQEYYHEDMAAVEQSSRSQNDPPKPAQADVAIEAAKLEIAPENRIQDDEQALNAWAKILSYMQKHDMFCYLFAKEAKVFARNGGLEIRFAIDQKAHYNVFNTDRGSKTLREAMLKGLGHMLPCEVLVEGTADGKPPTDPSQNENGWQTRVTKAAESLGIPIERKD